MLETLSKGLQVCAEVDNVAVVAFQKYFEVKLKTCLVKMHAATVVATHAKDSKVVGSFVDNLLYLRTTLPSFTHKRFLVSLLIREGSFTNVVEVLCC